ncbi:DUF1196 domain-containing protein [Vibrio cholerae]|nr:DUF1196 domain-containing protein [Vibrio cholerae]QHQ92386.1 DUF1196 domain-containing protein [Vibrio cholerae O1]MVB44663.1 DUF1196 domain-containing protein [Vibrio cholerae]MVB48363.1 DUF1196 domain-containing protein [Vibrio cholerae]MVB98582.1 DUF1196 domain-containing protein [Vibrio cholerae]
MCVSDATPQFKGVAKGIYAKRHSIKTIICTRLRCFMSIYFGSEL